MTTTLAIQVEDRAVSTLALLAALVNDCTFAETTKEQIDQMAQDVWLLGLRSVQYEMADTARHITTRTFGHRLRRRPEG